MSLIQISHLTFGYDGSYDVIFDDVSLQLDTDWKLGFTGRNGKGKRKVQGAGFGGCQGKCEVRKFTGKSYARKGIVSLERL